MSSQMRLKKVYSPIKKDSIEGAGGTATALRSDEKVKRPGVRANGSLLALTPDDTSPIIARAQKDRLLGRTLGEGPEAFLGPFWPGRGCSVSWNLASLLSDGRVNPLPPHGLYEGGSVLMDQDGFLYYVEGFRDDMEDYVEDIKMLLSARV